MSIAKTKAATTTTGAADSAPLFEGQSTTGPGVRRQRDADTDFVTSLLDLLTAEGLMEGESREDADKALREHFKPGTYYVAATAPTEREAVARRVLSMFNGRNARQIARTLHIGKTTVYRILKQAGYPVHP